MTHKVEIKKNEKLTCDIAFFSNTNCTLDSGYKLENFKIAYKSFGKLNKNKNNVILVCHALSEINLLQEKILLLIKMDGGHAWLALTNQ